MDIATLVRERDAAAEQSLRFRAAYEALIEPFADAFVRANALQLRSESLAVEVEQGRQALGAAETQRRALAAQLEQGRQALAAAEVSREAVAAQLEQIRRALAASELHCRALVTQVERDRQALLAVEAQRQATAAEAEQARRALAVSEAQRQAMAAEAEQVRRTLAVSEAQRRALAAEAEQVRRALAVSEAQRQALADRIVAIHASRSWRVTQPLRRTGQAARKICKSLGQLRGRVSTLARHLSGRLRRAVLCVVRGGANGALDAATRAGAAWRAHIGRPRTLWGVTPILTLPLLARCDRLLGLRSDSLVFTTYYVAQNFDINLQRVCEVVYARHPRWSTRMHKVFLRLALIRYDVFHLFCDRGLMLPTRRMEINEQEMAAIRHHGRRLYTYTYGADVRTRAATLALGRYNICAECPEPMKYCVCDDAEGRGNVARIRASATAMMAMGDMLAYVPGARNFHFWPIDTRQVRYVGTDWSSDRVLRVAHAPNHPHFKGTQYLVAAIKRLQAEGRRIELVQVQGVPNREVIALFASCDLVADQFIAGFHGYTALEAMALGKPVMCYLRDPSMAIDPATCPIINVSPDSIYDTLKDCLDGRHDLATLGVRSRAYLERYYSLEAVAIRLGELYLATAGFGERMNLRIAQRVRGLRQQLSPLIVAPPPVPWGVGDRAAATPNSTMPAVPAVGCSGR